MKQIVLPKRRYTRDELPTIERVRKDFERANINRHNSCYHGGNDGDWQTQWDKQEKVDIGYTTPSKQDEFESNVKSPMTSGRIEATMQRLRRMDLRFIVRPDIINEPKDKRKARVIQELLNNLFERRELKARLMTWFKDCLVHGSAFMHIYYLRESRKVKLPKTQTKNMSQEEIEKLKGGEKVYEEQTIFDYDDIAFEPVKIQEVYVDPSARCLHGTSYAAQYLIRRMLPSLAQFKAMFSADPDAKNVNKVVPTSAYVGEDTEFFKPPRDISDQDTVEVLIYYNKPEDRYIVVANDVLIKDMPIPYKHKQIPYIQISAYEVLHQLYGMGIPDKLMNIQSELEILKNLTYDRLHITSNPMLKIKKTIYGEFSKAYQTAEPGLMLPVNNQDDVATLDYPSMSFDMFRGIDSLERDAVIATQIDPVQMGVNQKYVSATTSMLTKEQMDAFNAGLIDTWTESVTIGARMCISLMSQFYTTPRLRAAGDAAQGRQARLLNIEVNPDTLEVREKRGTYSKFEVKPDLFNINGDWDVEVAPESVEVPSRAIEMQKSQAAIAQLSPFMIDPSNPQSAMMNPFGWINGPKVIDWYLDTNGIPHELSAVTVEDEDISIERASMQGKKMLAGEFVAGIAGEPEAHIHAHVEQLRAVNNDKSKLEKKFDEIPPEMMDYAPGTKEWLQLRDLDDIANRIAEHLRTDSQPKLMEAQVAAEGSMKPTAPSVPMPPGLTPAGGQSEIPDMGTVGAEEMPQGRPPMAAQ